MMRAVMRIAAVGLLVVIATGCSNVQVTKTGKGTYAPTVADQVEILMTKPDRPFEELATISVTGWSTGETAKMHNAMRAKAAPLGATAVILTSTGMDVNGYMWGNGVAVRWRQ